MPEIEDIKRIEFRPNDVVIVRTPEFISVETAERMKQQLREYVPEPTKILVLGGGLTLDVLAEVAV